MVAYLGSYLGLPIATRIKCCRLNPVGGTVLLCSRFLISGCWFCLAFSGSLGTVPRSLPRYVFLTIKQQDGIDDMFRVFDIRLLRCHCNQKLSAKGDATCRDTGISYSGSVFSLCPWTHSHESRLTAYAPSHHHHPIPRTQDNRPNPRRTGATDASTPIRPAIHNQNVSEIQPFLSPVSELAIPRTFYYSLSIPVSNIYHSSLCNSTAW